MNPTSLVVSECIFRWFVRALLLVTIAARFINLPPAPTASHIDAMEMIQLAKQSNAAGHPAHHGVLSTRGRPHGPVPIWILQIGFLATDDVAALRLPYALIQTLSLIVGVILGARALRGYCAWEEVATVLLIPGFWHYSRHIWDNPLLIPFSMSAIASYLCFCRERDWRWLPVAALFASLGFGVHMMALSLILAIGAHLLIYHRRLLFERKSLPLILIACLVLPLAPYFIALVKATPRPVLAHTTLFSFSWEQFNQGFKVVSIGALNFGWGWARTWQLVLGEALAYVLGFYGLLWTSRQRRRALLDRAPYLDEVHALVLALLLAAVVVQLLARLQPLIQYYHACWFGYQLAILLAWIRGRNLWPVQIAKFGLVATNAWAIWLLSR